MQDLPMQSIHPARHSRGERKSQMNALSWAGTPKRAAECIYWFAERQVPRGWTLPRVHECFHALTANTFPRSRGRTSIGLELYCLVWKRILSDCYTVAAVDAKTCAEDIRRQAPNQNGLRPPRGIRMTGLNEGRFHGSIQMPGL